METTIMAVAASALAAALLTYFVMTVRAKKLHAAHAQLIQRQQGLEAAIATRKTELHDLAAEMEDRKEGATRQAAELESQLASRRSETDAKMAAYKKIAAEFERDQTKLEGTVAQTTKALVEARSQLHLVEERTQTLLAVERRAKDVSARLEIATKASDALRSEIAGREDELQDLKSQLDLYSRIADFVGYGVFEEPDYLFEMPERYQAEIKRVRDAEKSLVSSGGAVELADGVEIQGSSKTGEAVVSGQAKLMLRAFNLECDFLIGKINPSNFDRSLDRIIKIAESLEKEAASLSTGITQDYIDLKFEEFRLVYEHALRKAQRDEEQRLIREQMREEQKAIREYEQAVAKAEKEQRVYQDLLEQAQAKLATAHENEKAALETRMMVLQSQLKEAIEAGQRAQSLAEQTRRGHIYVISNLGSFGGDVYKIGLTRRLDPLDRVRELGDASVPFTFDVHAIVFSEDAPALEAALHRRFDHARVNAVNRKKEFFHVTLDEIRVAVEELSGSDADFRTTAAADEYYETLRLQG